MRCRRRIRCSSTINRRHACSAVVGSSGLTTADDEAAAGDGDRALATIDDCFVNSNGFGPTTSMTHTICTGSTHSALLDDGQLSLVLADANARDDVFATEIAERGIHVV